MLERSGVRRAKSPTNDDVLAPTGENACERIPGAPLLRFELSRHDLPLPGTVVDRLFARSRERWTDVASDPDQKVLYRAEGPDWFQFVVWFPQRRGTSAIRVRRLPPGEMWSHGHHLRGRTLNCSLHHYLVRSEGEVGRLNEQVEIRSTSTLLTLYRYRMERSAVRAANEQLDELVAELRTS